MFYFYTLFKFFPIHFRPTLSAPVIGSALLSSLDELSKSNVDLPAVGPLISDLCANQGDFLQLFVCVYVTGI
jgi:hypothetical protein